MKTHRLPFLLMLVMMTFAMTMPVLAQDDGGGRDRGQRQRWEDMSDEEREQFQERMRERQAEREAQQAEELRERLGISEEDFEAIAPMIQKVQQLVRERDMATRGGGRGGPGQRGGGAFAVEMTDEGQAVSEAMTELREAVEEENSGDIKSSLAKLRAARTALDGKITEAREELRSVCTAQWEAEFVVMGVLD